MQLKMKEITFPNLHSFISVLENKKATNGQKHRKRVAEVQNLSEK